MFHFPFVPPFSLSSLSKFNVSSRTEYSHFSQRVCYSKFIQSLASVLTEAQRQNVGNFAEKNVGLVWKARGFFFQKNLAIGNRTRDPHFYL